MTISTPISTDLHRKIESFLYLEVLLLDENRFDEWLDLFAEDAVYMAPVVETLDHHSDEDIFSDGRLCIFEESKSDLVGWLGRLKTDFAHSEQPRSRVRRLITNVLAAYGPGDSFDVRSNFLVFQSRLESSDQFFVGSRRDSVVEHENGFLIQRREIIFAHRLLPRTLSILF